MGLELGGHVQRTPQVRIPESRFERIYEDSDQARKDGRKIHQDLKLGIPGISADAEYSGMLPSKIILNGDNRGFAGILDFLTSSSRATVELTEIDGRLSAEVYADEGFDYTDKVNEIVGEYLDEDTGSFAVGL